jgi:hypothetical protein
VATPHSYRATLENNKTESEALAFLIRSNQSFVPLDKERRREIMECFRLDKSFTRAFDLILRSDNLVNISQLTFDDITLVELKTTKKKLPNNPQGFFFGATENEFKLARTLGEKYKFCFVSLHPESMSYVLLSLTELEKLIRTNRTQYQINL